mmetsp:Transcript_11548/g.52369  ORF Transcript_11548/g.52369 Transcript_11548/m.52369 type:complete len:268 (+) Transcript_11548:496-1299(+)
MAIAREPRPPTWTPSDARCAVRSGHGEKQKTESSSLASPSSDFSRDHSASISRSVSRHVSSAARSRAWSIDSSPSNTSSCRVSPSHVSESASRCPRPIGPVVQSPRHATLIAPDRPPHVVHLPHAVGLDAIHTIPALRVTPQNGPLGGVTDEVVAALSGSLAEDRSFAAATAAVAEAAAAADDAASEAAAATTAGSDEPMNARSTLAATADAASAAREAASAASSTSPDLPPPLTSGRSLDSAWVTDPKCSRSVDASRAGWNGRVAT